MKGFENQAYLMAYIISNALALIMLVTAWKWPRIGRLMFLLLFAWASWFNWQTVSHTPREYLNYADLAISEGYRQFIRGWFSSHIREVVGFIATCQGLIALAMLLRGWLFKIGAIAGIVFLLAILPLGMGSAFPCTLIMAAAMGLLLRGYADYLWRRPEKRTKAGVASRVTLRPDY
jgi:hypothetical protein